MKVGGLSLYQRWQRHWADWWDARLPSRDELTLTQRNLYILPTRPGCGLAAVFLVLLLASVNEQLNLGYALSFTLASAALATVYQTHSNLQGMSLRLMGWRSVHAGETIRLNIMLSHGLGRHGRHGLRMQAGKQKPLDLELPPDVDTSVELDVPTTGRGWLSLPRLTIDTRYPLGIFRAWAYWRPDSKVLIWPALDPHAPALPGRLPDTVAAAPSTHFVTQPSHTPEGLRDYRRGDPLKWIAWKKSSHALASGTGLISREPATCLSPDLWLDFERSDGLQGLNTEARLSRLASWLYQAEAQAHNLGPHYGLRLPGTVVACGHGPAHLRSCLDTLAQWGAPP